MQQNESPRDDTPISNIFLRMGTHTQSMSKNIAISDDVYRRLKREKGDQSFSELIEAHLERGGRLEDVTGQRIFDAETYEQVSEEISQLSEGTLERMTDETP